MLVLSALMIALTTCTQTPDPEPQPTVWRVSPPTEGDIVSRPGPEGPLYAAGPVATDTKLPVGYPRPTPPGAIEIKHYDSFRRAEISGRGSMGMSGGGGFWPLFRHISSNNIAMTAPVEMEFQPGADNDQVPQWTMAFLYHTTEDGPTGHDPDNDQVVILDTPPTTVLAIGGRGQWSNSRRYGELVAQLRAWIEANPQWTAGDAVRVLGYNGPMTPARNQWYEVQIPISPTDSALTPHALLESLPIHAAPQASGTP